MSRFISSLRAIEAWRWMLTLFAAVAVMTLFTPDVFAAGLPTAPKSPDGGGDDMMHMMRGYIGWGIGLAALVIVAVVFINVGGGAIAKFNEWRSGKAEIGELKTLVVVGAMLLIIVVTLATAAIGVIATSTTFTTT